MVVYAAQGNARRSMALLWRTAAEPIDVRTGPGPKPGLSVDMIVDAAIAVADMEGMAGLSMRTVGQRLGCTAMALYTYVPNKRELLDLMYDRALAELPTGYEDVAGWRPALMSWARDWRAFYLRHPWVLQVSQARPVLGPNEYAALETLARLLYATGLETGVLRRIHGALHHFVRGGAQAVAESRQAAAATGIPDEEWWYARSALLEEVSPDFAERFPMAIRLNTEGGFLAQSESTTYLAYLEEEAEHTFELGLTALMDRIASAIAESSR